MLQIETFFTAREKIKIFGQKNPQTFSRHISTFAIKVFKLNCLWKNVKGVFFILSCMQKNLILKNWLFERALSMILSDRIFFI